MLKSAIDLRLGAVLQSVAKTQQRLETIREVLAELPSFDTYSTFRSLAGNSKDYISAYDLKEFLTANGVKVGSEELFQLMSFYNPTSTGLNYEDFIKFVLPSANSIGKSLRKVVSIRVKTPLSPSKPGEIPHEVKYGICRLINTELAMNQKTEMLKKALGAVPGFSMLDAFRAIDYEGVGHITVGVLAEFLRKAGCLLEDKDPCWIFQRLDKNRDGKLSYLEFVEGILPFEEKKEFNQITSAVAPSKTEEVRAQSASPQKVKFASPLKEFITPEKTMLSPSTQASTIKKPIMKSILKTTPILSPEKPQQQLPANEKVMAQFLQEQIWIERRLEKTKADLAFQSDFTFHSTFRLFDKSSKGYITFEDFWQYIKENELADVDERNAAKIFKFKGENGRLRFVKFIEMVSPSQPEYAKLVLNRIADTSLSTKTKVKFNILLEMIFKAEGEHEALKRKAAIDPRSAFAVLDSKRVGYISSLVVSNVKPLNIVKRVFEEAQRKGQ